MKSVLYALPAVLALSVAACSQTDSPEPPSDDSAETSLPTPATSPGIVHTKVAPGKGSAIALTANQSVGGSIEATRSGELVAFGVRIGNYRDSADGSLTLELCVEDRCQNAAMPLQGSKDNDYLVYSLPEPVSLTGNQRIDYTLVRGDDASNRVAIWAYPAHDDQTGITNTAGEPTELVPRLELHYR